MNWREQVQSTAIDALDASSWAALTVSAFGHAHSSFHDIISRPAKFPFALGQTPLLCAPFFTPHPCPNPRTPSASVCPVAACRSRRLNCSSARDSTSWCPHLFHNGIQVCLDFGFVIVLQNVEHERDTNLHLRFFLCVPHFCHNEFQSTMQKKVV